MLSYATQVDIPNAEMVINENFLHLGGVVRYAFEPNVANAAVQDASATELFKLVETGLTAKFENQMIVDRLIHRILRMVELACWEPPSRLPPNVKNVAMSLALESRIETKLLLEKFKTVGATAGMRCVLFEACAARKIADGDEVRDSCDSTNSTRVFGRLCVRKLQSSQLFGVS